MTEMPRPSGPPDVRLRLPATPESLTMVRQALTGMAEVVGIGEEAIEDLKVAVTEACTNVVVHAYAGRPGSMEVDSWGEPARLVVLVRDFGTGFVPRVQSVRQGLGLGLQLIASLASEVRISAGAEAGTEVLMAFERRDGGAAPDRVPSAG